MDKKKNNRNNSTKIYHPNNKWRLGDVVLTLYGVGVIVGKRTGLVETKTTTTTKSTTETTETDTFHSNNAKQNASLDSESSPSLPTTTTNDNNVESSVLFWIVRLWRIPEKSIVSSSISYLTEASIKHRLPIAPGMIASLLLSSLSSSSNTTTTGDDNNTDKHQSKKVLIVGYSESKNIYYAKTVVTTAKDDSLLSQEQQLQSEHNNTTTTTNNSTIYEIQPKEISSINHSGTIYPLIEVLLVRAEQAANVIKKQYKQSMPTTLHVLENATNKVISIAKQKQQQQQQQNSSSATTMSSEIDNASNTDTTSTSSDVTSTEQTTGLVVQTASRYLEDWTAVVQQKTPDIEQNAKNVWQMIKDDEITTLFEKCKSRLNTLTTTTTATILPTTLDAAATVLVQNLSPTAASDASSILNTGSQLLNDTLYNLEQTAGIKIVLDDSDYLDEEDDDDADTDTDNECVNGEDNRDQTNTQKVSNSKVRSVAQSVRKTQRIALNALEQLLQQQKTILLDATNLTENDLQTVQSEFVQNMTNVLDTLQQTAKSDRVIGELFDSISTTNGIQLHQQITGRIIQTKSASLFVEGAARLHSRAMSLFANSSSSNNNNSFQLGTNNNDMLINGTNAFLKSFTERDAAIARIKSIELGQAVKNKLINAIEIRTESMGGLDAIIAGALSTVTTTMNNTTSSLHNTTTTATQQVQSLVSNLHQLATTTTTNANETLLSILSSHSRFRDVVLLRIEQTLYDLLIVRKLSTKVKEIDNLNDDTSNNDSCYGEKDDHVENDDDDDDDDDWRRMIEPEQIVALIQGEGGTLNIFEPIAKRAMKQIDKQLTIAEQQIRNQMMNTSTTANDTTINQSNDNNSKNGNKQQHLGLLLDGLQRIRKLMSGELTVNAIMDEVVSVLNDDKFVAIGEKVVQHSESILDAIENATSGNDQQSNGTNNAANRVVAEALQLAEKSGITKENVMKELDTLNVTQLLGTAEQAVHDEKIRQKLFNDSTDTALDFLLKILPSMPVPPFDGVKDGLLYNISNLSMKGFKVRKEDIQIDLAGIRATKQQQRQRKEQSPKSSSASASASLHETNGGIDNDTNIDSNNATYLLSSSSQSDESDSAYEDCVEEQYDSAEPTMFTEPSTTAIKATELLIIDVQNISASLDNALWSFEQTYLPYLKGKGAADVKMSGGSIRLQFELRKQKKKKKQSNDDSASADMNNNNNNNIDDEYYWEPVLCLHDRSCTISDVELILQGEGRLTWMLNKLVTVFKGPLRDYVVRTIVRVLSNQSGWILKRLNTLLNPYWDIILRTAKLNIEDLLEADQSVIIENDDVPDRTRIELVWRERLPLGMNLLMNDESGLLKVVDFPRGSAARAVCEMRKLEPDLFKGSTIVAVNGRQYDDQDELFEALKDPSRPKSIQFELAKTEEIEKLLEFVEGPKRKQRTDESGSMSRQFAFRSVEFVQPGALGIEFAISEDKGGLVVNGFLEGDGGTVLGAARTGSVNVGDILTHINDECVFSCDDGVTSRAKAVKLLESFATIRPLKLTFSDAYLHKITINKSSNFTPEKDNGSGPSSELQLNQRQVNNMRRIFIEGFNDVSGVAESSGIFIGDHLVFLNGMPVGIGCEWLGAPNPPSYEEVMQMLQNDIHYPIGLTFARPKQQSNQANRWNNILSDSNWFADTNADTSCVVAKSFERLGCVFTEQQPTTGTSSIGIRSNTSRSYIVVADFLPVSGTVQQCIINTIPNSIKMEQSKSIQKILSIESINGEFVPTYASVELVKNALRRSWNASLSNNNNSSSNNNKNNNNNTDKSSLSPSTLSTFEIVLCDDDLREWLKSNL